MKICGYLFILAFTLTQWGLAADPFGVDLSRDGSGTNLIVTVRLTIPAHHHIYADQLRVESESGIVFRLAGGDQPVPLHDTFAEGVRPSYTNDVTLRFEPGAPVTSTESLKVSYQGCSEEQCFFPKNRVFTAAVPTPRLTEPVAEKPGNVPSGAAGGFEDLAGMKSVAAASGYLNTREFLSFLNKAEGHDDAVVNPGSLASRVKAASLLFSANPLEFFKLHGVWWTVLIILTGGLLLNLTPCVLPMIPINLAIIGVGAQNGTRTKGFFLGGAYGLGIALVYGFLGIAVVLTGSQFGVLNSLPWFNAVIGVVFVVLALAMFDVFAIDMARFQRAGGETGGNQGKVATAMFMGGISALLAGACVAPVVIAVLLLSNNLYAQGAGIGLMLPFILGAGMALPWPFAGSGLSFLPKPGAWMTWVKTGFGVFILMFAVYYFSLAYQGWWGKKVVAQVDAGVHQITGADTTAWKAVVAESVKTGKPVFIDFWATWCKNCEAMELTTFRAKEVKQRLSAYVVVKFQAENLSDKGTRAATDFFGVKGLPTYVVLKAGSALP
ncbi:MAG: cytochrome c biogenesis protein CcdA [bacterium]